LPITGTREMVTAWTLRINQIDVATCPDTSATAYVSVIDQGGFPVTNLVTPNFTVTQGTPIFGFTVSLAATTSPVAIAAALDHSASLTQQPVAFADMKSGFSTFFGGLRAGDEGAVINFDSAVELVQDWTPNQTLLQSVIAAPWDKGPNTRLYDAANLSVTETAKKTAFRRAAIIATDGVDDGSSVPLDTAIGNAQTAKVPLFMVGVGSSINRTVLTRMAVETGGLFFEASTSQNLATIYQQLSSILYGNQYVVKFNRLPAATTGSLPQITIGASLPPLGATDIRPITLCP
jgi:Ca-activated chloride channel family protein